MTNFDFHRLLFPTEFENFCRDLLEIRETGITFTTYRRGRDGGIDIRATNSKEKIIGQCKLYDPTKYNVLLRNLKKELATCKRENANRYILCINIELTPLRSSEILEIFSGYIKREEDIIDGIKLNKYLSQEQYQYLFKSYSKLLIPNFQSIELALDKVFFRKYYQKTTYFLHEIETKHRLFHHTAQLPFLIQHLEENKVIILTGNPGVGKTTTAMMIANFFLSKKVKDLIFLEERDYTDTLSIAEENRLIIVDDFWGQNFSPQIKGHDTFQREFQTIIGHFTNSKNCFLILTSRDYVIRDVLKEAELETENLLNTNKHVINIEDHSREDKVKILLNHLLFYDFDLSYFQNALYNDTFEHIIKHRNYSPRHLDFFIKTYLSDGYQSRYAFYDSLFRYLDNPTAFWNDTFQKLNPTAKAILLILLVSGDPMDIKDLKSSFNDIQIKAREILNEGIIPGDFDKEFKKLEEFYISINQDEYYHDTSIKFQSPGIKDYLLEFLRNDGYLWIHPIILKARFFNQLTFVFCTKEEKISDFESDIPLYGQKILLSQDLKALLKQKLLYEFEVLNYFNTEPKELSDQLTRYHSNEETQYFKLKELIRLFPIDWDENRDVRDFILDKVLTDIKSFDDNRKVVTHRSMIYFPSVIQALVPYLEISPQDIIQIYYRSIGYCGSKGASDFGATVPAISVQTVPLFAN
ncbi:MAG: restriction endonuclease [Imperialibacter sp.]|uniref:nSTAND3 domain-containing NTPase n=1 Tax=Imperialibacter sp. TaxID=2038411 RepID=UPI003A85164E